MKRRLNSTHRNLLFEFLATKVTAVELREAEAKAYVAAVDALKTLFTHRYPQADMKVLGKYGMARYPGVRAYFTPLVVPEKSGAYSMTMNLRKEDGVLTPTNEGVFMFHFTATQSGEVSTREPEDRRDARLIDAGKAMWNYRESIKARERLEAELRAPYIQAIEGVRTFEALVELWPEANSQFQALFKREMPKVNESLAVVGPTLKDLIAADMLRRGVR